jgi:spermidine synthase
MYRGSLNLLNRTPFKVKGPRMEPYNSEVETVVGRGTTDAKFVRTLWFTDRDANQALSLRYTGDCLSNEKSPFQNVRVFQTPKYGKMLTLDSAIMVTERDEQHYHEMLVHPAMQTLGNVKKVLVIGGGDGGTIREVLKYTSVEKVVMVEIDEKVVEASRAHFPFLSRDLSHPKLDLRFEDGIEFVKNAGEAEYDAIFVDGSDPVGTAEGLFS